MTKDTGGPAFPHIKSFVQGEHKNGREADRLGYHTEGSNGMTLRQWYAGQALVGIISSGIFSSMEADVEGAFNYADTMLKEESKP